MTHRSNGVTPLPVLESPQLEHQRCLSQVILDIGWLWREMRRCSSRTIHLDWACTPETSRQQKEGEFEACRRGADVKPAEVKWSFVMSKKTVIVAIVVIVVAAIDIAVAVHHVGSVDGQSEFEILRPMIR